MVRRLRTIKSADCIFVFGAGLAALVAAYKRITGIWVNVGARSMAVWTGMVLAVLVPAFVLADGCGHHWVMVPAGAVLGVAVTLLGRRWNRALAAELRGGR